MRIIKEATLRAFGEEYPDAAQWLEDFATLTKTSDWQNLQEVRKSYPHADAATVTSDKTVTIFNVRGNRYRLVMALHYNTGVAFVLRFMTHAEYSKDRWKDTL